MDSVYETQSNLPSSTRLLFKLIPSQNSEIITLPEDPTVNNLFSENGFVYNSRLVVASVLKTSDIIKGIGLEYQEAIQVLTRNKKSIIMAVEFRGGMPNITQQWFQDELIQICSASRLCMVSANFVLQSIPDIQRNIHHDSPFKIFDAQSSTSPAEVLADLASMPVEM